MNYLLKKIAYILPALALFFMFAPSVLAVNTDPGGAIGPIHAPPGVDQIIDDAGTNQDEIAILFFISNLVVLLTVIAGLWSTVNIVLAGYTYVTNNGKAESHEKVKNQVIMSIIGLVFILTAYTFAGILGLVLFGDPAIFLNPVISSL